ncbi:MULTISPECIES: TetR/AcrR family transcriptional regulator C-terminal domain-containing protein [unclassified Microbacterium]|uniref:TetR/AcrR family transcriptional regulator C-terminal domain-containing protein n=1 Tax=unclassified Microbacterium TaxID=2609290 RepID=UPI000493A789|nr:MULTISPECIES: TetR/AcrR family transcriptional regulator C-terminal domain-containing protein [unclassified Microbacterium]
MAKNLVDLLWRKDASERADGRRGPRSRVSVDAVVSGAIELADAGGTVAMTIRALAQSLDLTAMSVYTHVNSRADLLVLMVDEAHARMATSPADGAGWRARVRRVADENLALFRAHAWLLDVDDARVVVGPGTIAKYDRELRAFDDAGLSAVERDAALSFVLDFVRATAARMRGSAERERFGPFWADAAPRVTGYLGADFPLAQAVGQAAGEAMDGPYDADVAWGFGVARVIDGLAGIVSDSSPR